MNAASEFNLNVHYAIYAAIKSIMDEDYDAWVRMDKTNLFAKTIRRMQGKVNPEQLRQVINDL